jgi:hypothetical protein
MAEVKRMYDTASSPVMSRSRDELRGLFGNFELIDPGLVWTPNWHPEESGPNAPDIEFASPNESVVLCGVGRKP